MKQNRSFLQSCAYWSKYTPSSRIFVTLTICLLLAHCASLGYLLLHLPAWHDGFQYNIMLLLTFAQLVCVFMGRYLEAGSVVFAAYVTAGSLLNLGAM